QLPGPLLSVIQFGVSSNRKIGFRSWAEKGHSIHSKERERRMFPHEGKPGFFQGFQLGDLGDLTHF
ncbi:MAG: hypothetical protein ACD_28C00308G0001, partial [uncultured bacterium]